MATTKEQLKIAGVVVRAIYQTIHEMGKQGAPSGVIYAGLSAYGMTLAQYDTCISALINLGAITQDNYVLYAVPEKGMELGLV